MQTLLFAFTGLLLLVAENSWKAHLPFDFTAPQLTLIWVLALGLLDNPVRGALFAFAAGFVMDSLVGAQPGLNATIYATIYFIMKFSGKAFFPRSLVFHVIAAAFLTFAALMLRSSLLFVFPSCDAMIGHVLAEAPTQVLVNCAAAIVIFPIMFRLDDLTGPKREDMFYLPSNW